MFKYIILLNDTQNYILKDFKVVKILCIVLILQKYSFLFLDGGQCTF